MGGHHRQQEADRGGPPEGARQHQGHERQDHHHKGQPGDLLGQVGGQVAPQGRQGLEQVGRQAALEVVLLKGLDHPDDRELAHHKSSQEVAGQLQGAEARVGAGTGATPDAEHDQGQHARQGPEGNLGAVFEHQGVLAGEQRPGHPQAMDER